MHLWLFTIAGIRWLAQSGGAAAWLALAVALGVGALLGMLAGLGSILGLKRDNARLRRREKLAVEEVNNLRSIPIREP